MKEILPPPRIMVIDGVTVVDDSSVGTKFRMAVDVVSKSQSQTFNFASSAFGESPLALAKACQRLDRKLNLFYPNVDEYTPQMLACLKMGAEVYPLTSLSDENFEFVIAEARSRDGEFVTFNNEESVNIVARAAQSVGLSPENVWAAGGFGGITRGLQLAWPDAQHFAVEVNSELKGANYGKAEVIRAKSPFTQAATNKAPFPCNQYFEAKAWARMQELRGNQTGIVFWNPAAK